MCFSAEASFTAGTILTISGAALIRKFRSSKKIYLAFVPLFFGIQQLSEGVVWESLKDETFPKVYGLAAQYIFLFFAKMFWPVWIPLAFGLAEKVLWRRIVMGALMLAGFLFFFGTLYYSITEGVAEAKIVKHSISYGASLLPYRIFYGVITMTPFLLSSLPNMWIFGIANTIGFIVADVLYGYAFTSVWCAVCAFITIGFFLLLKKEEY